MFQLRTEQKLRTLKTNSPSHVVLKRGGSDIDDGAEPHARRPDLVPGRALFLGKTFFGRNSSRSRDVELDEGHVHS